VRDPDRWRIAAVHPLEPGGDTPEDALRRLIAAIEARDFDALVAILADPLRTTLEQALGDRLSRLKSALRHGSFEMAGANSSGSTARLRYDPRYHIDLILENGRWRVADFN
jgi:Glu-tRNA(Gln) amidotransferase subunit E-like FAD-binding protein